jgi:hypothetical protein
VLIQLSDPDGHYEPQRSQRNVDVTEYPPCDATEAYTFTVYNHSPLTATVDIGLITFDVPTDWQVSTVPSDTLVLGQWEEGVVTVTVMIPCEAVLTASPPLRRLYASEQEGGGVPTIDVEGYIDGQLVGGIELQFEGELQVPTRLYLPLILRNRGAPSASARH